MTSKDSVKQTILLIEDDPELASLIKEYLESAEFLIEIQSDGVDAVQRIIDNQPDLVILDLMLPGKDGISICREARRTFENPILMLTASSDSVDHILALEVGADDFINKPVEPRILLAHIRALLRRMHPSPSKVKPSASQKNQTEILCFGHITINTATRQVKSAAQVVELSTPEYDILLILAQHQGKILSRDDIFKSLRGIEYDGQNRLVDITICQLRSKLGHDGQSHRHIKTIRNKGYVCVESID
jgi:two-component system response regulator RstA